MGLQSVDCTQLSSRSVSPRKVRSRNIQFCGSIICLLTTNDTRKLASKCLWEHESISNIFTIITPNNNCDARYAVNAVKNVGLIWFFGFICGVIEMVSGFQAIFCLLFFCKHIWHFKTGSLISYLFVKCSLHEHLTSIHSKKH